MTFNKKEQSLLKDLQSEEKMCAEKYRKAAENANDPFLQQMFNEIGQDEQEHYETVTQMLSGVMPEPSEKANRRGRSGEKSPEALKSKVSRAAKQQDQYLLDDLLATEKFVSGAYNTSVFEFSDEKARQTLSKIQQQEQHHGKQLSAYMQANGMYC